MAVNSSQTKTSLAALALCLTLLFFHFAIHMQLFWLYVKLYDFSDILRTKSIWSHANPFGHFHGLGPALNED